MARFPKTRARRGRDVFPAPAPGTRFVSKMINSQQHSKAKAYWTVGHEKGELRSEDLPAPGPGEALVRTLYSGISKGTETGGPLRQRAATRCRTNAGAPPGGLLPVAGEVRLPLRGNRGGRPGGLGGPDGLLPAPAPGPLRCPGRVPDRGPGDVPARRAVLTGTVETAVNALVGSRAPAGRPRRRGRRRPGRRHGGHPPAHLSAAAAAADRRRPGEARLRRQPSASNSPTPTTPCRTATS